VPTNARNILTDAYYDLGVIGQGEPMDGAQAVEGLRRLNNLVSTLRTQTGVSVAIQRTVFPLVANQQTYTIGLGGDFNVPRPQKIDTAGLWLEGLASAQSVTSITRSGYTATVTQTAHPFAIGDEAFIDGANEIAYNGLQTVQTVPTADTYTFTVQGLPTTPATGTITAAAVSGQPVEIPRSVITTSAYEAIQLKNMPNAQFTNVYYNPTFPFGTIILWPRIDTAINQLILYLPTLFEGFADLTTLYDWPSIDGYAEMLEYNIAKRLRMLYPLTSPRIDIDAMAAESLGLIKRANNKLVDVPTDASLLTKNQRGWYNINTDGGG
jgi:hypothetical protein